MFLCNGKPEWQWQDKVINLEPHKFQQWRNGVPSLRKHFHPDTNQANFKEHFKGVHVYEGLLMDADEVAAWGDAEVEVTISRIKGLASNARELQQTIFQVSIAGIGLMQIQCVELLENCCTVELQNWLDRGWRIVAVCPPNDTRRPSYIMGHVDKEPHR